jgi:hypothetical protein
MLEAQLFLAAYRMSTDGIEIARQSSHRLDDLFFGGAQVENDAGRLEQHRKRLDIAQNGWDGGRQDHEIRLWQEVGRVRVRMVDDPFFESQLERRPIGIDPEQRGTFSPQRQGERTAHQPESHDCDFRIL